MLLFSQYLVFLTTDNRSPNEISHIKKQTSQKRQWYKKNCHAKWRSRANRCVYDFLNNIHEGSCKQKHSTALKIQDSISIYMVYFLNALNYSQPLSPDLCKILPIQNTHEVYIKQAYLLCFSTQVAIYNSFILLFRPEFPSPCDWNGPCDSLVVKALLCNDSSSSSLT